ncbi:hypothetical protein [Streptomyces sp. A5-4]|uniref:hypothetical protein n=1 Tax=Streptomyces sp. A5-4 TaxID=3384771 RepID=UPI003DA8DFAC
MLFTMAMLGLTVTMAIFTRYIRRQLALVRSGRTMEPATPGQVGIFMAVFFVVALSLAAVL